MVYNENGMKVLQDLKINYETCHKSNFYYTTE